MNHKSIKRFALIGAAGYVAPRHMKAIKDTGNELVAAYDPHDSVGILDSYFPDADFFTEFERFDRHLEKLKRSGNSVDYVSICSPNYLHDAHIRFGLRIGADVICEKPTVLNPWNVKALKEMENEYRGTVNNILQLRLHSNVKKLKENLVLTDNSKYQVELNYVTARGKWYDYSWKGDVAKSGGVVTNIGIHFFDILIWIFGDVIHSKVLELSPNKSKGKLELENAFVNWSLSTDILDIPEGNKSRTYRSIKIDGNSFDMTSGFDNLHTVSYDHIIKGKGFKLSDIDRCIDLVYNIRNSKID